MANLKRRLTASNIKYLLVINELNSKCEAVRSIDIASMLGVTRPSVHGMTETLKDMELLQKSKSGEICLTEIGAGLAEEYSRCYAAVYGVLTNVFPPGSDMMPAICALLAEMPAELTSAI